MASPVIQTQNESATSTASTSHVVSLPSGITAGDLILICMSTGTPAASSWVFNSHSDYTELLDEDANVGLHIWYRWATGGESDPTLVSAQAIRSAEVTYRISGAKNPASQLPEIGTTSSGSSTTPDPPASATPGASREYLFITFCGSAGEQADDDTYVTSFPTNYTLGQAEKTCGVAGTNLGGMIGAAARQVTTGSAQDPGTFTVSENAAWRAQTIMVHPATSTPQSIDAAVAISSAMSRQTGKTLAVAVSPVPAFLRQTSKSISATVAAVSAFSNQVAKTLGVAVLGESTLAAARSFLRSLDAAVTVSVSVTRQVGLTLAAAISSTVDLATEFITGGVVTIITSPFTSRLRGMSDSSPDEDEFEAPSQPHERGQ